LGVGTGVAVLLLSGLTYSEEHPRPEKPPPLAEFISRVCPDGHDEDWRVDGPVVALHHEMVGGLIGDHDPAFQTSFVLYGDGTVIARVLPAGSWERKDWGLRKHRLDPGAVASLMRDLNVAALLSLEARYSPLRAEREHRKRICFDACNELAQLNLWPNGCRTTINIWDLDSFYLQVVALGRRPPRVWGIPAQAVAETRLALKRLPPVLTAALLRLSRFKAAAGTPWCTADECSEQELPRHEAWAFEARSIVVSPSPPQPAAAPTLPTPTSGAPTLPVAVPPDASAR
jgi:hypothetical protein